MSVVEPAGVDDDTTDLAQVLVARLAELRRLGGGTESFPLVLDDPFAGLDRAAKPALLELLVARVGLAAAHLPDRRRGRGQLGPPRGAHRRPVDHRARGRARRTSSRAARPTSIQLSAAARSTGARDGAVRRGWPPSTTPRRSGRSTTSRSLESTVTFDLVPRTLEEQLAWLQARSGAHAVLVAEDDDGEVVGFALALAVQGPAGVRTTVEDSVYVRRDQQGQGVGRVPARPSWCRWPPPTASTP